MRHRVIQHAQDLDDASQACREAALSRTAFARWRQRFEPQAREKGLQADYPPTRLDAVELATRRSARHERAPGGRSLDQEAHA